MAYSYKATRQNSDSGQTGDTTRSSGYSYRAAHAVGANQIQEDTIARNRQIAAARQSGNLLQDYYNVLKRATDYAANAPATGRSVTDYQTVQNQLSRYSNNDNILQMIRTAYGQNSDAEKALNAFRGYQRDLGGVMANQMSYYAGQTPTFNSYAGKSLSEMEDEIQNLQNAREEAVQNGRDTAMADRLIRNAQNYVQNNLGGFTDGWSSEELRNAADSYGTGFMDQLRNFGTAEANRAGNMEAGLNRLAREQEREEERTARNEARDARISEILGPMTGDALEDYEARENQIQEYLQSHPFAYSPDAPADEDYGQNYTDYEYLSHEYQRIHGETERLRRSASLDALLGKMPDDSAASMRARLEAAEALAEGYVMQTNDITAEQYELIQEESRELADRIWYSDVNEARASMPSNVLRRLENGEDVTKELQDLGYSEDQIENLLYYGKMQRDERIARERERRLSDTYTRNFGWGLAGTVGTRTAASLTSGLGFADSTFQLVVHPERPINYNTALNRWANTDEIISEAIMNEVNWTDQYGNDAFDKLYSFTTSTLDSVVTGLLTTGYGTAFAEAGLSTAAADLLAQGIGDAVFFGSAAQSYMRDAVANGATDSQAIMGGLLAGTAEALFEHLSLEHFYDSSMHRGSLRALAKDYLISAGINGSEEVFTEISNILTDWLVMGDISDVMTKYNELLDAGYTEDEAKRMTVFNMAGRALEAGISGMLQGAVMSAVSTASSAIGTARLGRRISDEGVALLQERTGRELNNAYDRGVAFAEVFEQTRDAMVSDRTIENYLRTSGVTTGDMSQMVGIVRKTLAGSPLTPEEFQVMRRSPEAARAFSALVQEDGVQTDADYLDSDTDALNKRASQLVAQNDANKRLVALAATTGDPIAIINAAQEAYGNNIDTQEYTSDTGYREALSRGSLSENAAQMRSNLYAAETARVEQENIGRRERQEAEVTPISEETFSNQFSAAYNTGRAYYDRTAEQRAKVVSDYGEWAGTAFDLGAAEVSDIDRRGAARARTAGTVTDITQAELQKLFKDGGAIAPSSRNAAELAKMSKGERDAYNRRKVEREAVEYVAKAVGAKVVLYESTSEKTANGWYDHATGTIYLDVKAGDFGNRSMLRAMAHELTHLIQTRSKSEYAALRSFILDKYFDGKQELLDRRVNEAMENDPSLKPEYALDEVIADSCEMMLRDSEAIKQIYNENRGLFNRIKDFIDKVANAIKKAFEGVDTYSEAANDMREYWGEIQKLWDAGLVAASQSKEQSGEGDGRDQSSVQYSFRGVDNAGRRVYESDFPAGMTEEERKRVFVNRVAAIFNLARVELYTPRKRITVLGDKYTAKKNAGQRGASDNLNARIDALYDLADILETAEYVQRSENEETEPSFNSGVSPKNDAHRGVRYWYRFKNRIVLDGVPYDVTFSIRDMVAGKQYAYYAKFVRTENGTVAAKAGRPIAGNPTQTTMPSNDNVAQISGVVNPSLDEKTAMRIAMEQAGLIDENGRSTIQSSSRRSRLSSIDMVDAIDNYDGIDESIAQSLRDVKELYSKYRDNQHEVARINEELRGETQNRDSLEKRKASLLKTRENLSYQIDAIMEQKGVRDFLEAERTEMVSLFEESAGAGRDYVNRYYNAPMRQAIESAQNQTAAAREQTRLVREAGQERLDAAEQEWRERFAKLRQRYSDSKLRALEKQAEEMRMSFRERMERQQERRASSALRETARNRLARLVNMIETNNDKTHIITELRGPVAKFIEALNPIPQNTRSESARQAAERWREALNGIQKLANENAPVTSLIIEQNKDAFKALSDQISNLESLIRDNSRLTEMGENLQRAIIDTNSRSSTAATVARGTLAADTLSEETSVIDYMNSEQLTQLNRVLRAVQAIVNSANRVFANAKYESRQQMVEASHKELDKIEGDPAVVKVGNGKVEQASLQTQRFLAWRNGTPYYVFKRFGEVGKNLYMSLAKAWGQMSQDVHTISEAVKAEGITEKETQKWRDEVIEAQIPTLLGKTKTAHFTMAQLMSLYCHFKQEQSLLHINGGGFTFAGSDVTRTDYNTYHMSMEEAQALFDQYLSPEARRAADFLQHYMQTVGARMGNVVTRALYGYEYFNPDEYYFPVRASDDQMVDKTSDPTQSLFALLHMTETRARNPKANSKLVVGDIFDIFNSHMADMAKYKNLALPVLDIVNWLNGRTSGGTIKEDLRKAFGAIQNGDRTSSIAGDYVSKFIKDINATYSGGGMIDQEANKFLTRMKKAAVAASLRVALQQPFSYTRAMYTMKPRYLLRSLGIHGNLKQNIDEAMKWSGLARAKSEGAFSSDLSPTLREQIIGSSDWRDKISRKAIVLAEKMDEVTWGAIWRAAKYQVENEGYDGKFYKKGSNEYFEAVRAVFDEVILSTQVMDGTLTRSEFMRDTTLYSKIMTAFMAEPTLTYNMMLDGLEGVRLAKRSGGDVRQARGKLARAMGTWAATQIANALITALVDSFRDDDDYERFFDKFADHFGSNLLDNMNPLAGIPLIKTMWELIVSTWKGSKSPLGTEFQGITQSVKALRGLYDTLRDEKTEANSYGKMSTWGLIYSGLQAVSYLSGLPIANFSRTVTGAYNVMAQVWNDVFAPLNGNYLKHITTYNSDTGGYDELFQAEVNGNTQRQQNLLAELAVHGIEGDSIGKEMRTRTRDAFIDGSIGAQKARSILTEYGFDADDVEEDINFWTFKRDYPGIEKPTSSMANAYYATFQSMGIPAAEFAQYWRYIHGDGITKDEVRTYISSLQIPGNVKAALWGTKYTSAW